MSTHTQGPWHINGGPNPTKPQYITIYVKPGDHTTVEHVCHVGQRDSEHWIANARVIAAAPEMLSVLKEIVGNYPYRIAMEVIAKAEGRAS